MAGEGERGLGSSLRVRVVRLAVCAAPRLPRRPGSRSPPSAGACVATGVLLTAGIRLTRVRSREHSGQRIPTGVGVMQSGQIGRPQLEHETPVSRLGCR